MIARVLDLARSFVEGAYQPLEPTSSDKTSVTEETDYPSFCASAVRDDAIFASFRRMSPYVNIVDCCDEESGLACLKSVLRSPEVAGRLDVIRESDRVGDPVTHDYGAHGTFSPTTLRYAKIARDIGALFGDRRAMDVIEIGVGYGGQCRILEALSPSRSYALVDLPPALDLARKYLTTMGVACAAPGEDSASGVRCVRPDALPERSSYDLVISNFAFSELSRSVQDHYLDTIITRARRGFMILNHFRYGGSYAHDDLVRMIPGSMLATEHPFSPLRTRVMVWDKTAESPWFRLAVAKFSVEGKVLNMPRRVRHEVGRALRSIRAIAKA